MARPKKTTITEATVGDWFGVSRQSKGSIGFTVSPHLNSAGNYDVNFTVSPLAFKIKKVPVSRSTTVLTITLVDHGLTTADDVVLNDNQDYLGVFRVATTADQDTLTVVVPSAGIANHVSLTPIIVDTLTGFTAATGKQSGNFSASVSAIRVNATNVTTQPVDLTVNQGDA